MKRYLLTVFIALCLIFFHVQAQTVASKMLESGKQPYGINLASACFGKNHPGVFNKDYTYPTVANLDYMKSKGLALVRLCFTWERLQPELFGELDKVELSRLQGFVDEAAKCDMLILFDMHNYCRRSINNVKYRIGENGVNIKHIADVWGKIADVFKSYKNIYGYGLMNEPYEMLPTMPWAKIAQACINKIRKIDSKTAIFVGGDRWSSAEYWYEMSDDLKNLYDPSENLVYEVHVYFDNDASGSYKKSYDEENANPYIGIERIQPFVKWLKENNKRGFVGEYGIPDTDERWQVCLDNFLKYLQEKGIGGAYWAGGPWWHKNFMAIEPINSVERPQMKVVEKYLWTK
jgi:endoglucanase